MFTRDEVRTCYQQDFFLHNKCFKSNIIILLNTSKMYVSLTSKSDFYGISWNTFL